MTGLLVPAGCLALIAVILTVDWRRYKREVAAREQFRAEMRQERRAALMLRPHTGDVEPAPRLAPLADIIDFPKDAA